jgi:hypothetical protein
MQYFALEREREREVRLEDEDYQLHQYCVRWSDRVGFCFVGSGYLFPVWSWIPSPLSKIPRRHVKCSILSDGNFSTAFVRRITQIAKKILSDMPPVVY